MSPRPPEPTIRRASPEDLGPRLLAIEAASHPVPWTERVFQAEFENPWSRVDLLEQDGAVAGFIVWWLVVDEVHILNVSVDPIHRGRGYGRSLVVHALESGTASGATHATLEVRVGNVVARGLYESLGFVGMGTRRGYYQDNGEDALVMGRMLSGGAI